MESGNSSRSINRESIRRDQLLTVQDLFDFKNQLLSDICALLKTQPASAGHRWLKSIEIRKMLQISAGKLQYLRDKKVIPFTKLGGVTYYDVVEIEKLMQSNQFEQHLKM